MTTDPQQGLLDRQDIRHVLWDWNGTLLNDMTACVEAINVLLQRRGLPVTNPDEYLERFGFPVRDYYLKVGFDLEHEDWDTLAHEYHEAYAVTSGSCGLRRGAVAVLEDLRRRRVPMSVLSASEQTILEGMLEASGIGPFFEHVYGLTDLYAHSKLDLGRELVENAGLDAQRVLMVGDTIHDYEVAMTLGMRCLLMAGGHQSRARLAACDCDLVNGPRELAQLF